MNARISYDSDYLWSIEQVGFDYRYLGKTESIMALGNGYMGVRSSEEEEYVGEVRNTFVAGTFDSFNDSEVSELPNVADMWGMKILVNEFPLNLLKGEVLNYKKKLDLKNGLLTRSFSWKYKDLYLNFKFRKFISKRRLHLGLLEVEIDNLGNKTVDIHIKSGINGKVTNSGSQHFLDGVKELIEDKYIQMTTKTLQSNIEFVQTIEHKFKNKLNFKSWPEVDRRAIYMNYNFQIASGLSEKIEKRCSIYTSIDNDLKINQSIRKKAISELRDLEGNSFNFLLEESSESWNIIWDKSSIFINSIDLKDQLSIRFAQYHLHIMTPAHDTRMNIGAKGLSGEGYKGHTFWDTEIFMLPYFSFTFPDIANSLLSYRYIGLEGARKKSKLNGFEGAQYPWESAAPTDGEMTPIWGGTDILTGKETKIWSGFIEQHVTADIAFGVRQYIDITGDEYFALNKGFEIILDTANFWSSRLEWNSEKNLYEINDVIGPDEYKEHVNNNAFTNYLAYWNLQEAKRIIDYLKENNIEIFLRLNRKLNLDRLYQRIKHISKRFYLPKVNSLGILPQDDSYLSKKELDISCFKGLERVGSLFQKYSLSQINEFQISKQADVLLLFLLFEHLFNDELKLVNFEYYEPKTTHDSSLSLSTHAILSADLKKMDLSYLFFKQAINIDMGEYMNSSNDGIHAASLGGIWQMVVFGYGGVRVTNGELRIEPNLPLEWHDLEFNIEYRGRLLKLKIDHNMFKVTKERGEDVEFKHKGRKYKLSTVLEIFI